MHQKITSFFSLDWTKLAVFLAFSLVALAFFAWPSAFLGLALPVGGLYYLFLSQVFMVFSQALGFYYYPSLGDSTFSVVLAATAIGYFYLLSSYITYVARRKHDFVGMLMMASVAMVFISPFLILSIPPAISSTQPVTYAIADGESCTSLSATGTAMKWNEEQKTCYLSGTFVSGSYDAIGIANGITFEIQAGGNFTTARIVYNNGTIVVNGGVLKNAGGYIFNRGTIDHRDGTFANGGVIETGSADGYEMRAKIINRADLDNTGYIYSRGNFTNLGSFDNTGQVQFFGEGSAMNAGRISSNGRIEVAGEFDNEAEVLNSGILMIYLHLEGSATNRATVVDNFGEIINTVGEVQNLGDINNYGTMENDMGRFENHGRINNRGTVSNAQGGEFLNDGIIKNYCDAVIEGQIGSVLPAGSCNT